MKWKCFSWGLQSRAACSKTLYKWNVFPVPIVSPVSQIYAHTLSVQDASLSWHDTVGSLASAPFRQQCILGDYAGLVYTDLTVFQSQILVMAGLGCQLCWIGGHSRTGKAFWGD